MIYDKREVAVILLISTGVICEFGSRSKLVIESQVAAGHLERKRDIKRPRCIVNDGGDTFGVELTEKGTKFAQRLKNALVAAGHLDVSEGTPRPY